jgi:hypothetical protein
MMTETALVPHETTSLVKKEKKWLLRPTNWLQPFNKHQWFRDWSKPFAQGTGFIGSVLFASYAMLQSAPASITGVVLFLGGNILALYIDVALKQWQETKDSNREAAIMEAQERILETTLTQLLRILTEELLKEKDAGFRATILLPDKENKYICPAYRYQYGAVSGKCPNPQKVKFPKNIGLAGIAWGKPSKVVTNEFPIGTFNTEQEFREFYKTQFKMSDELVNSLSVEMQPVRSIFCIGLVDHNHTCIGIISLDSIYPDAFNNITEDTLASYMAAIGATLENNQTSKL